MNRVRLRFVRDAIGCAFGARVLAHGPQPVVLRRRFHLFFKLFPDNRPNWMPKRCDGTKTSNAVKATVAVGAGSSGGDRPADRPSPSSPSLSSANVVVRVVQKSQKPPRPSPSSHIKLIGAVRAMNDYCLSATDLNVLPRQVRRSPYIGEPHCVMYLESDVRSLAIKVHGSAEALQKMQNRRRTIDKARQLSVLLGISPATLREKQRRYDREAEEVEAQHGAGHVVLTAVSVNAANCAMKFFLWLYTGSHSLFAECVHSLADTLNQVILAFGIRQSLRMPDTMHPYGYSNARYVASLISGVGIFCFGTGLSVYHGIQGLLFPQALEFSPGVFILLGLSFVTESVTFVMAAKALSRHSRQNNISFRQCVLRAEDPSLSVVFLEDMAALMGVGIAVSCLLLSKQLSSVVPDAIGSLVIGGLLGCVASVVIYANSMHLVGRSIPQKDLVEIIRGLEDDDIKATKLGSHRVRFKAEIDVDGRNVTRSYIEKLDLLKILQEMKSFKNTEEVESFLLNHGELVIDRLGAEIDRIEQELIKKFPELRHVDLELL